MSNPVLPAAVKALLAQPGQKLCDALTNTLLALPALIYRWFVWEWNDDGTATTDFKAAVNNVRTGDLIFSASPQPKSDRLLCDGSAVSRTTYADLFAELGTLYGVGDGSTTFNIPDYRDKFTRGKGTSTTLGGTGGADSVDVTIGKDNLPNDRLDIGLDGTGDAVPAGTPTGTIRAGGTNIDWQSGTPPNSVGHTLPIGKATPVSVATVPSWVGVYIYIKV